MTNVESEIVILGSGPSELANAQLGTCRFCQDYTVLPEWSDGRCFGCTTDEYDEPEPIICSGAHRFYESDDEEDERQVEIVALFEEAQGLVPAFKVIAHMCGPDGSFRVQRRGLYLRQAWGITTPTMFMADGFCKREANSKYANLLYAARQARGLCGSCSRPPVPGFKKCARHITPPERYLGWRNAGLCIHCGDQRSGSHSACDRCLARHRRQEKSRRDRLKAAGLCRSCGARPADDISRCSVCKEKRTRARRGYAP